MTNIQKQVSKYAADCRTFPGDAVLGYRLEGVRGLRDAVCARTLDRVFNRGHVLIFAQPLDLAPDIPPPSGVVIRPLTEPDWPGLASIVPQRDLVRFRSLVAAGRHGVVAWRGPQPIGYGWVAATVGPDVTACPLRLPPYAAYLWDLYVTRSERSNGVGSALASARIQTARSLGFREGWRMISPLNLPSLRTLAKSGTGTRLVGELRYTKLLSRVHARFTPVDSPDSVT